MRLPSLKRYHFESKIGEGATGSVFRVRDQRTGRSVALKLLTSATSAALMRFKQEFRSLTEVRHPNVVRIYELAAVDEFWFYTMELVDGQELMEHLALQEISSGLADGSSFEAIRTRRWDSIYRTVTAPGTIAVPDTTAWTMLSQRYLRNLRISMRQLASGVRAIHQVGFVHRDIKPANIVVTGDGRVVLLDFGLARPVRASTNIPADDYVSLAGTPGYMSPEQAARLPLAESSDWYSFGVVLFQALTGTLPFTGGLFDIIVAQQSEDPPRPASVVPDTPADLDELCVRLLDRDPSSRPEGDEVVSVLGGDSFAYWIPDFRAGGLKRGSRFVGRERELDVLHECLAETLRRRELVAVEINGASGTGKTALVNQFCDEARLVRDLMVLYGRCYSSEAIPYNAFDQIFDGVARHLAVSNVGEMPALPALTRRFPVLERDDVQRNDEGGDIVHECCRLLEHLGRSTPVLAVIDEAQRADDESLDLLVALLDQPAQAPVLMVILHSDEDRSQRLIEVLEPRTVRSIVLGELGLEELRLWSDSFLGTNQIDENDLVAILRDTGGDAYLAEQVLAFMAQERGEALPGVSRVLDRKLQRIPKTAFRLLRVLAETDRPLDPAVALQRAGLPEVNEELIGILRSERLARSRFTGDTEQVEIYHDRVRDWILKKAPPSH